MSLKLENCDETKLDSLCFQYRNSAVQHLSQTDAFRGKSQLDMAGETPEIYWKNVHNALAHIPVCECCARWVRTLYSEMFRNPDAMAAERLYQLVDLRSKIEPKKKQTKEELKERDSRQDSYCCSFMFRAVEGENGYNGLKVEYGAFRDERMWRFAWDESKAGLINTGYCPWCGEKMPAKEFVA